MRLRITAKSDDKCKIFKVYENLNPKKIILIEDSSSVTDGSEQRTKEVSKEELNRWINSTQFYKFHKVSDFKY